MRFTSSEDFKTYTKKVSENIKNTPLRPLRLAMAKAEGYTSIQAYCIFLDQQPNRSVLLNKDSHIENYSSTVQIVNNENILFKVRCALNEDIKFQGIEAWNDYINEAMNIDFPLHGLSCEKVHDDVHICEGYIPCSDIDDEELENVLSSFFSTHLSNDIAFTAEDLTQLGFNYLHWLLNEGESIYGEEGFDAEPDVISDIKMNFDSKMFLSFIPTSTIENQEQSVIAECANNDDLSLTDMKAMATRDLFDSALRHTIDLLSKQIIELSKKNQFSLSDYHEEFMKNDHDNLILQSKELIIKQLSLDLVTAKFI